MTSNTIQFLIDTGDKLINKSDYHNAIKFFNKVLTLQKDNIVAFNNGGICFLTLKNYNKALEYFINAYNIDNQNIDIINNIGICYTRLDKLEDAILFYEKSVSIKPELHILHELGFLNYILKNTTKSIKYYSRLENLFPNSYKTLTYCSLAYLLDKNFTKGFQLYENRFLCPVTSDYNSNFKLFNEIPIWDGTQKCTKVIIIAEQGFGDTIQFFRFVIEIAQKFTEIEFTFFCQKPIGPLLNTLNLTNLLIKTSLSNKTKYDFRTFTFSVPKLLNITNITPYTKDLYININKSKALEWKHKLSHLSGCKIGICYKGANIQTLEKYIPLYLFEEISNLDINIILLQKGDGEEEYNDITFKNKIVKFDIDKEQPFIDTISILQNIDLLITVDTAIVHLAGLLNINTYLLLGKVSEWRWGINDDSTYWYNSVSILRNNTLKNWTPLLDTLKSIIEKKYISI